jgi:pimeloyl-ACP methyl ester carboxylesterase
MTPLPLRAGRAVLTGAGAVRQRAAGLELDGLRAAVRRRGHRSSHPVQDGDPVTVDALVAGSLPELAVSALAENAPLPAGSRTVDLDGPVHYVEHGDRDAPAIVCVHGLGGSHANWHDLAPLLARTHRVLSVDLAGHGRTPRAGRSASIRANRTLLSRFLVEVAGGSAVLVGNSMGGTLGLLQAAEEPETVRDLVLIGPAAPRVRHELPDLAVARQAALFAVPGVAERVMARRRERLGAEGVVAQQMALTTADSTRVSQEMRQVAVDLVASRANGPDAEAAFLEAARSLVALLARPARYREVVAAVQSTALVIHGELDRLVPLSCSQALVRQRPDWRLEVLEGVGHVPQIEVPERTADAVLSWLARRPSLLPSQPVLTTAGGAA